MMNKTQMLHDPADTDLLFRQAPLALSISFVNTIAFVLVMWPVAPQMFLRGWFAVSTLILAARFLLVRRYLLLPTPVSNPAFWDKCFVLLAAASGFCWGFGAVLFFPTDKPLYQMFSIVMLGGLAAGGVTTLSSSPRCYRAFLLLLLSPLIVRLATLGGMVYSIIALVALLFMWSMLIISRRIYRILTESRSIGANEQYRSRVMEMLAKDSPLPDILHAIVKGLEAQDTSAMCSILLVDRSGQRLLLAAAPSLPEAYNDAVHGLAIGPQQGACGTAAHTGRRIISEDIRTDPLWRQYQEAPLSAGLLSCWSEPIRSASGQVLGAFAIYHRGPSTPGNEDIRRIETAAHLAGVAIERSKFEEDLELAALVYRNSSEAMVVTDAENRVIAINPAFSRIVGYNANEIMGTELTTSMRNAGDVNNYRRMIESVLATGHWQGELWHYRKNRERFACRVTVNSIFNADGTVNRRVVLLSDITEQKLSDEAIWKQAYYDPLIGLPNRRLFRDRLEQEIKKAHRAGLRMGLLFLDLDRFKEVNDSFGHDAGDKLLIEAARRIGASVREADTVARLGGDEFTVILSEIEDGAVIERVARDIVQRMIEPFHLGEDRACISVSIGITVYPDNSIDADALIRNADLAMYAAKNAGRNRYRYYTGGAQQ